jgi:hypothetical protein
MIETTTDYHRRRAAEEMAEAAIHSDDITAELHRRLAEEHLALAGEAEKAVRMRRDDRNVSQPGSPEAGT